MEQRIEDAHAWRPAVVMSYYLVLKAKRFVVLAGPPEVEKVSLARQVAQSMAGPAAPLHWCSLQGHAWWATHTGSPARFAAAQAQLNYLKVVDFLELAMAQEQLAVPCFVMIDRISPAEAVSYFCDLPRGLLWRPDASAQTIHVPKNLYVTGLFDTVDDGPVLSHAVHEHAQVIRVGRGDCSGQVPPQAMLHRAKQN